MKFLNGCILALVALIFFYGLRQEYRVVPTQEVTASAFRPKDQEETTLRVLTRRGYFSSGLLRKLEQSLHAKFQITYYWGDDECRGLLESGETWDLMLVPDHVALSLDRLNRTRDIDYGAIPNHRNASLGPLTREMGALYRCSVPLFYTTVGIGYSSDVVGGIPLSWKALFFPKSTALVRGRLGLLNDSRRSLGVALIALGKSPNTRNPEEIEQAVDVIKGYMMLLPAMDPATVPVHGGADFIGREMAKQRLFGAMITSAAASKAMETNKALRFSLPIEGSLLCLDCLVVPRTTRQRAAVDACINLLLQPQIAAQLTNESGFATTNQAATAYFLPSLYHGPAFATPTGKQFFFLQDVGGAEALYRAAWHDLSAYYETHVAIKLRRDLGLESTFIESNDRKN